MSRIPTLLSSENVRTGSTGPEASPLAFDSAGSAGMEKFGQGALHLAQGVELMSKDLEHVEKTKEHEDNLRWVGRSLEQEKNNLSEWLANPENSSKETYAQDFLDYANARRTEYEDVAPNKKALDLFNYHYGEYLNRRFELALHTAEQTRMTNSIQDIDEQISNALGSFRNAQGIPNTIPSDELFVSHQEISQRIDEQFARQPNTRAKLQEHLDQQVILGSMAGDTQFAQNMLNASTNISEEHRRALQLHIDQLGKADDAVRRDEFNRLRADHLTAVEHGKQQDKMDIKLYEQFYPADKAIIEKRQDDAAIDIYNRSNDFTTKISATNGDAQLSELNKLKDGIKTFEDEKVYNIVAQNVRHNVELQEKNRVAWLRQNNPEVKAAISLLDGIQGPASAQAVTRKNEILLKYQGYPPPGTDPEEANKYLNLPTNDRELLSVEEAERAANDINKSPPKEVINKINTFLGSFPDEHHQMIAFNNLVTMPPKNKGIMQEYQLAWQNKDAWWVDTYLGAVKSPEALSKLTDEKKGEIHKYIESDATWKKFQLSMIGDNMERANEIEGFKSGITAYSHALMTQGKTPKQASTEAINLLIGSTLGFTSVNGRPLAILRTKADPSLPPRTDDEVSDIGRRLSLSLQYIDPRAINQDNFSVLKPLGDEWRIERLQALRDIVTSKGFFQTGNDGKSVSLYVLDDNGFPFQLRDHNNKAFQIMLDELPAFDPHTLTRFGGTSGNEPRGFEMAPGGKQAMKTIDILNKGGDFFHSWNYTNWPVRVPWLKNEVPSGPPTQAPQPEPIRQSKLQAPSLQLQFNTNKLSKPTDDEWWGSPDAKPTE